MLQHFNTYMFPEIRKNKDPGGSEANSYKNKTKKKFLLKDLHETFIKYKLHAVGTAQTTIKNYRHNFQLLLQFKPDISTDELTEELIVNFMEFLNTRYRKVGKKQIVRVYKNSSIATVRGKLNTFFEWLIERGYLINNPFHKIKYPDVSYTDPRAFSPREFESICHAINTRIQWSSLLIKKRNIAIVMFLTLTGVRKEELLGLQTNDIDFERLFIKIRAETSKSKRSRFIPISPQLLSYLEDYLIFRKDYKTDFFWVSGNRDRGFTGHGAKHLIDLLTKTTNINCHLHCFFRLKTAHFFA